jgi:hypothetical protein
MLAGGDDLARSIQEVSCVFGALDILPDAQVPRKAPTRFRSSHLGIVFSSFSAKVQVVALCDICHPSGHSILAHCKGGRAAGLQDWVRKIGAVGAFFTNQDVAS